ncbi:nuclease-related domain-containing protein, partial [Neobacillus sp. LXY-1]|uniref:nuclease-related domain-containing protein n=1 Tax=Neobacillus sp. LXY-1 TaxID=3379133 RepID=UPI003EE35325
KQYPHDQYIIIHDLELQYKEIHFQIDNLLLSQKWILMNEVKNIQGKLTFDNTFNQLTRKNDDGTEDVFEDPRIQAKWHYYLLGCWLTEKQLNFLPIEYLIFFSSIKSNLKTHSDNREDFRHICKGREIFHRIINIEKQLNKPIVDRATLEGIANTVISYHNPKQYNILEEYSLQVNDLQTGVSCPTCSYTPICYRGGIWHCPSCGCKSKDAHVEAIYDFFYLIKPEITNSVCRDFLYLPSNNVSQKKLQSLKLPTSGATKNRVYFPNQERMNKCDFL